MFSGKKKEVETIGKATSSTVIGKETSLEGGTLKGNVNVRVDGYYVGDIIVEGSVTIGDSGAVYGDISADSATISGNYQGNIVTAENVRLTPTAVVEGTIECKAIIIDEKATFNGICKMVSLVQLPSKDAVLNFDADEKKVAK